MPPGTKVAKHQRFYTCGGWAVQLEHYLDTLIRKPGSIAGSEAMKQVPASIRKLFLSQFKDCPKDFIMMLLYARDNGYGYDAIIGAYETLRSKGIRKVSGDQIKAMLGSSPDGALMQPGTDRNTAF